MTKEKDITLLLWDPEIASKPSLSEQLPMTLQLQSESRAFDWGCIYACCVSNERRGSKCWSFSQDADDTDKEAQAVGLGHG